MVTAGECAAAGATSSHPGEVRDMETFIGFVVGFLVGSREGREGADRVRASLVAIGESDEVQSLIGRSVSVLAPLLGNASRSRSGLAGDLVAALVSAAAEVTGGRRAT
jgi:hypothetical protein